ncbi:hypothetical protein J7L68_03305, partial [bacterium]|nr:hypothetical protein [bacterium]
QLSESTVESYISNDVNTGYVPYDNGSKLVSSGIYYNGNVGIGTATLAEKLTVSGRISLTTDPNSDDDVGDRAYNDARYALTSGDGSYIQNQTGANQSASFRISGRAGIGVNPDTHSKLDISYTVGLVSSTTYGVRSQISQSDLGTSTYAGYFKSTLTYSGIADDQTLYGVYAEGLGDIGGGGPVGTVYGIYAKASNGATNWAGYFNGNVNITGNLTAGSISTAGGWTDGGANVYLKTSTDKVGIGTTTPNASAKVEISSTTQGVLFPRMTCVQRSAISSPPEGLIVYNTTSHQFDYYNGSDWMALDASLAPSMPSAPTANASTFEGDECFRADWNSVTGATSYRLDVSLNSSFSSYVPGYNNYNAGGGTNCWVGDVTSGIPLMHATTYYYRVRAVGGCGTSSNSNVRSATTTDDGTMCP